MRTFITRPIKIQAMQYKFGERNIPGVTDISVDIVYSIDEQMYYITGGRNNRPERWLVVNDDGEGKTKIIDTPRKGKREPVEQDHPLYIRYANDHDWTEPSEPYGILINEDFETETENRTILNDGDWVVFWSKQKCIVIPKDEFDKKYTEVVS